MSKYSGQCNFSLFWYTSLACNFEKQITKADESTDKEKMCELEVPLYDQVLDLKALRSKNETGYMVHSGITLFINEIKENI